MDGCRSDTMSEAKSLKNQAGNLSRLLYDLRSMMPTDNLLNL